MGVGDATSCLMQRSEKKKTNKVGSINRPKESARASSDKREKRARLRK